MYAAPPSVFPAPRPPNSNQMYQSIPGVPLGGTCHGQGSQRLA
jgi:hypothetical protein